MVAPWVHCNLCFRTPRDGLRYSLSTCDHIFCHNCLKKGACKFQCALCKHDRPQLVEINRNLPPHLKELFLSPAKLQKNFETEIKLALEFQRARLNRQYKKQMSVFGKLKSFAMEQQRLNAELKKNLETVKGAYFKQQHSLSDLKRRHEEATGKPCGEPFKSREPKTPFATSTPKPGISAKTLDSSGDFSMKPDTTYSR